MGAKLHFHSDFSLAAQCRDAVVLPAFIECVFLQVYFYNGVSHQRCDLRLALYHIGGFEAVAIQLDASCKT